MRKKITSLNPGEDIFCKDILFQFYQFPELNEEIKKLRYVRQSDDTLFFTDLSKDQEYPMSKDYFYYFLEIGVVWKEEL